MNYNRNFEKRQIDFDTIQPYAQRISYYSDNSEYIQSDRYTYSINEDIDDEYSYRYNDDNTDNYDYNNDFSRDIFHRSSLYTVADYNRASVNLGVRDNIIENDVENDIIDLYMQSYIDESNIEPIMQLPLSPNQYRLMKEKWNKQLELDITRASRDPTPKIMSWSGWSNESSDFLKVPRNSNASDYSEQSKKSTKSTKSWKSFFSKFSNKNKKNQKNKIPFYENLLQQKN